MNQLYSQLDLERWVTQNAKKRQLLERRLDKDWSKATDAQGLSMLSLSLDDEGYTAVAIGNREEAIRCFHDAVVVTTKLLEMGRQGIEGAKGYVEAGYFQTLLKSLAIGDEALTAQFAAAFQVDGMAAKTSLPDSAYIARLLKALTLGKIEEAQMILAIPAPNIDSQFIGYVECLRVIAESRWCDFENELRRAADAWERFTRRDCAGHPRSVCFVEGLGLLNLAKRVSQKPLAVSVEHLPNILLQT